jgi:hypothetical protein
MKIKKSRSAAIVRWTGLMLVAWGLLFPGRTMAAGTWTALSSSAPSFVQLMLLLADGTVMAQNVGGNAWYRLSPDIHGSYVNGSWTTLASMHNTRQFYSSAVLRDGRVFVAGAEYGTGSNTAEVYDPVGNTWTLTPVSGQNFIDSISKILPDGRVLIAPVQPNSPGITVIYDPFLNIWSNGGTLVRGGEQQDEASWVKLPDDSILTIDPDTSNCERYIPSLNQWVNDASVRVAMYDILPGYVGEIGAAFLLPNGRAFFLGGTGHTAIYTPSGNSSPGTWVAGPDIPNGQVAADAAGAMMVNGKILCAVSAPLYVNGSGKVVFPPPTSFYEYDYSVGSIGSFTQVSGPTGATDNVQPFIPLMLDLPDGTVLYSHYGSDLYVYAPDGSPLAAGKPTITSITANGNGSYHLTGTGLNGISEGAAYGDDAQMNSNYPLVRVTDGSGNVYYLPTFNWSSTGVRTGNNPVSTEFFAFTGLAAGASYSLVAVANGIASDPVTFYGPVWVDFNSGDPTQIGSFDFPYHTLAQGISAVPTGGTISIKTAGHSPELMTISKPMSIVAFGGLVTLGQ